VSFSFSYSGNTRGEELLCCRSILFRQYTVSCAAVAGIMSYGGLYIVITYLPLWFQAVKGVSPLTSEVYYLPSVFTTTFGTVAIGYLGMFLQTLVKLQQELRD
jgi:predicted MFS family arabinose efflux permease